MHKRCSICILRRDEIQALEGRHCGCSGGWSLGAAIIHGRSPRLQGAVAEPCSIMQTEGHCWHARRGQGDKCLSPLPHFRKYPLWRKDSRDNPKREQTTRDDVHPISFDRWSLSIRSCLSAFATWNPRVIASFLSSSMLPSSLH